MILPVRFINLTVFHLLFQTGCTITDLLALLFNLNKSHRFVTSLMKIYLIDESFPRMSEYNSHTSQLVSDDAADQSGDGSHGWPGSGPVIMHTLQSDTPELQGRTRLVHHTLPVRIWRQHMLRGKRVETSRAPAAGYCVPSFGSIHCSTPPFLSNGVACHCKYDKLELAYNF